MRYVGGLKEMGVSTLPGMEWGQEWLFEEAGILQLNFEREAESWLA